MQAAFAVSPNMLADANPLTQWVIVAAIVAGTGVVLFKSKFRPKKDPLARSPETGSLAQHRSVERQMQGLLVELSEMSRNVTAGLDTRAAKLDALIREADAKIAALSSLQNGSSGIDTARSPSLPASHLNGQDHPTDNRLFVDTTPELANTVGAAPPPSPYDSDPRHAQVYLLADQGQTAAEIANQLQRPAGEVQLILALRTR